MEWITILAIVVGPLLAVLITVWLERRRRDYERRHNVFRSLMKTRRTWANPEHVEALNLVEIEFHGYSYVLEKYRELIGYFETGLARRDDETDARYAERQAERHSNLLSALLLAMSKHLGYGHNQFEILRGGYSPILHGQIEEEQTKIRKLFAGLHDGTMVLPVGVVDFRHPSKILEEARVAEALMQSAIQDEKEKG